METLRIETAEFGEQVEWELSKGAYIATANYCNQIASEVEQFKKDCEEWIKSQKINCEYIESFKAIFPEGKITQHANARGIFYQHTYNMTRRAVMTALEKNNLLKVFSPDGSWNPRLAMEDVI